MSISILPPELFFGLLYRLYVVSLCILVYTFLFHYLPFLLKQMYERIFLSYLNFEILVSLNCLLFISYTGVYSFNLTVKSYNYMGYLLSYIHLDLSVTCIFRYRLNTPMIYIFIIVHVVLHTLFST